MNNGFILGNGQSAEPNSFYMVGTSLWMVDANGNRILLAQSPIIGQITLVAGTKAVAIGGVAITSKAFLQLVVPATAGNTVDYQAVCTASTLTVTALLAAKTINAVDVSTLNYIIYE